MNLQGVNFQNGAGQSAVGQTSKAGEAVRPVLIRMPGGQAPAANNSKETVDDDTSREEMPKIIEGINAVLARGGSHIRFVEHQAAQKMMVQILDDSTGDVIRTIPSKEMLDLAARISEMIGIFIDRET